jgi:hypothetical protein
MVTTMLPGCSALCRLGVANHPNFSTSRIGLREVYTNRIVCKFAVRQ